jgi:hypothetical protein
MECAERDPAQLGEIRGQIENSIHAWLDVVLA